VTWVSRLWLTNDFDELGSMGTISFMDGVQETKKGGPSWPAIVNLSDVGATRLGRSTQD